MKCKKAVILGLALFIIVKQLKSKKMSDVLSSILAEVQSQKTVIASAKVLIAGLRAQLASAGTDAAQLQQIQDALKENDTDLAAAIVANTDADTTGTDAGGSASGSGSDAGSGAGSDAGSGSDASAGTGTDAGGTTSSDSGSGTGGSTDAGSGSDAGSSDSGNAEGGGGDAQQQPTTDPSQISPDQNA